MTRMTISDLNGPGILHVVRNMRTLDREEIFATQFDDNHDAFAATWPTWGRFGYVIGDGVEPVAVIGAIPMWPHVWTMYMFATDRFDNVGKQLTKFTKYNMLPAAAEAGALRGECKSLSTHHTAHRWLRHLGAEREATLRGYGKNGEDFDLFVWRP